MTMKKEILTAQKTVVIDGNEIDREQIVKVQAVLAKHASGGCCFFNYSMYVVRLKLLKEHGVDSKNCPRYVLTQAGERLLNITI